LNVRHRLEFEERGNRCFQIGRYAPAQRHHAVVGECRHEFFPRWFEHRTSPSQQKQKARHPLDSGLQKSVVSLN
jgi:hypothetical protein